MAGWSLWRVARGGAEVCAVCGHNVTMAENLCTLAVRQDKAL